MREGASGPVHRISVTAARSKSVLTLTAGGSRRARLRLLSGSLANSVTSILVDGTLIVVFKRLTVYVVIWDKCDFRGTIGVQGLIRPTARRCPQIAEIGLSLSR
jgi:membrane-associated PAP2 superfamily phosphatase